LNKKEKEGKMQFLSVNRDIKKKSKKAFLFFINQHQSPDRPVREVAQWRIMSIPPLKKTRSISE
jgi:hypothetical protein